MRSKVTVKFIDLIRPDCYWPMPYTIEQAFGIFRWMLETGEPYRDRGDWGWHCVKGLLSKKPTCVSFSEIEPITSVEDLRDRFHYAILSQYVGPNIEAWREKYRITPAGKAIIHFPHYEMHEHSCEADCQRGIDALLGASGFLTTQLNEFHRGAKQILGVKLHFCRTWEFILDYGYDHSVWHHTLARQPRGEPFLKTFQRAVDRLGELTANQPEVMRA